MNLDLSRLNDEHFLPDVILPADLVPRQVDDWTKQHNEVLEQTGLAVAEQFHLGNN